MPRKPHGRRLARCTLYKLPCGSEQGYRFADRGADLGAISLSLFHCCVRRFWLCFVRFRRLNSPSVVFCRVGDLWKDIRKQTTQLPSVICLDFFFFCTPVGRPQKGPTPPRLAPDTTWLECAGRAATRRSGLLSLQGVITNGTWRLCRSGV